MCFDLSICPCKHCFRSFFLCRLSRAKCLQFPDDNSVLLLPMGGMYTRPAEIHQSVNSSWQLDVHCICRSVHDTVYRFDVVVVFLLLFSVMSATILICRLWKVALCSDMTLVSDLALAVSVSKVALASFWCQPFPLYLLWVERRSLPSLWDAEHC